MPDTPRVVLWLSRLVRLGLALALVAGGVLVAGALYATRPHAEQRSEPIPPLAVRTVLARPAPVDRRWTGYGTARAMQAAGIPAEVEGRVIERPASIEPGAPVAAGDLIVRIDPHDYERRVESGEGAVAALEAQLASLGVERVRLAEQVTLAEEEAAATQRDLERTRRAMEQGAGTQADVDQRLAALRAIQRTVTTLRQQLEQIDPRERQLGAQLAQAQADLRLARQNLERTEIRAPLAGVLQSVAPREGEYVRAGDEAARVVDVRRIEVPLRLPVSAGPRVRVGNRARLAGGGAGEGVWEGEVSRVSPEADPQSRTIEVFVEVRQDPAGVARGADRSPEPPVDRDGDPLLLPGQFVTGEVFTSAPEDRLVVPRGAVVDNRVLVAEAVDGSPPTLRRVRWAEAPVLFHVEARFPDLDPDETQWAVLERQPENPLALRAGMLVVTSNLDTLRPGTIVDVSGESAVRLRPAAGEPPREDGAGEAGASLNGESEGRE